MERRKKFIPNRLKLHRKQMGYKQRQVATLLGLHDTVPLSLWERGVGFPSTVNLIKLSILYRTFPNELYDQLYYELREEIKAQELQVFIHQ